MAAEALNGVSESETSRGISMPLPVFRSEYAVEVEPNIAFALMLRKRRGYFISAISTIGESEKSEPDVADNSKVTKDIRLSICKFLKIFFGMV